MSVAVTTSLLGAVVYVKAEARGWSKGSSRTVVAVAQADDGGLRITVQDSGGGLSTHSEKEVEVHVPVYF